MDSPEIKRLWDYLLSKRIQFVRSVRERPNSDGMLLTVAEDTVGPTITSKTTSRRQMRSLAKAIERDLGIGVEFLISKGQVQEEIEAGLSALLTTRFKGEIQECFVSFVENDVVEVWLERVANSSQENADTIKSVIKNYLKLFGIKLGAIRWTASGEPLPSTVAILRELKIIAPAPPFELAQRLRDRNFQVPSDSWIEKKLDAIRKQKLVVRSANETYTLTEGGLRTVPPGKGRLGSDVARGLALGRRKW